MKLTKHLSQKIRLIKVIWCCTFGQQIILLFKESVKRKRKFCFIRERGLLLEFEEKLNFLGRQIILHNKFVSRIYKGQGETDVFHGWKNRWRWFVWLLKESDMKMMIGQWIWHKNGGDYDDDDVYDDHMMPMMTLEIVMMMMKRG